MPLVSERHHADDDTPPIDELGIAEAIRDGILPSPQKYENLTLFDLRITGTGLSYRTAHDEYVWRDPSLYLNDRFLRRCAGLTVTWEHPEKGALDSKEFGARVIGSIMFAFIVGDAVHGIAKIYDDAAAKQMLNKQLSTSPGVVLRDVDDKVDFDDSSVLLIEGEPKLLDHISVCGLGVWDKGGPATGVVNSTLRTDSMTTEEEKVAAASKARADAEAGEKLSQILDHMKSFSTGLTSVSSRLDAIEADAKARRDSEDKEKEERADKARKDAKARRDAERADWAKDDAEACAKDDAEEEEDKKKFCDAGDDEDMAMDKARMARKDRMKARKDASEKEEEGKKADAARKDKERADAEAQAVKERADSILADRERSLAEKLAGMPKSPNDADYGSMSDAQAYADSAYQAFGKRAPVPLSGETPLAYRRRLANGLKAHSPDWKDQDLARVDAGVLTIAEKKIYADAEVASRSSADVAEGIMIPRRRVTDSGHQVTEYRGKTTIFEQFSSPPMYATAFLTNNSRGA